MSRAVITHFDGDPFTINTWLLLYEKYWRGECDVVYATLYYNPSIVPEDTIIYCKSLLDKYPEIRVSMLAENKPPETGNHNSLLIAQEDYIGFIESDGLIYAKGMVDQCFRLLENEGQDIVAPPWHLIDDPYMNGDLQSKGFMRCFFFTKKSILERTDLDFMPRTILANTPVTEKYSTGTNVALDCFGWLSWQMLLLTQKITYTPANILAPQNILSPYSNFKWVHVRQMSSSAIGLGGAEYDLWTKGDNRTIVNRVVQLFGEEFAGGPAEFIHVKAVAFKLLFWELLPDKAPLGQFATDYKMMLDAVVDYYGLPKETVHEIKGFYKGLFNL